MIKYELELNKDEARIVEECLDKDLTSIVWVVIKKAFKRGNFKKIN